MEPRAYAMWTKDSGAGELFVQSIDLEGARSGYDIALMKEISAAVQVPVVACGGAGSLDDIRLLFRSTDVAAAAAGTMFVLRREKPMLCRMRPHADRRVGRGALVVERRFACKRKPTPGRTTARPRGVGEKRRRGSRTLAGWYMYYNGLPLIAT